MAKKNLTLKDIKMHHDPHAQPLTAGQQAAVDNATPRRAKYPYHRKHKTIAVSIDSEEHARLKTEARRRDCSLSDLIRPYIQQLLADLDTVKTVPKHS